MRESFANIENLKIVVCGGDGTVQWVLSDIDSLVAEGVLSTRPGVAILPLGTGNDLSRQYGWGHGYSTRLLKDLRMDVDAAAPVALDHEMYRRVPVVLILIIVSLSFSFSLLLLLGTGCYYLLLFTIAICAYMPTSTRLSRFTLAPSYLLRFISSYFLANESLTPYLVS